MSALAKCKALVLLAVPSSLAIVIEALELFKIFVDESDPLTTNLELPPTPLKTLVLVTPMPTFPLVSITTCELLTPPAENLSSLYEPTSKCVVLESNLAKLVVPSFS